MKKIILLKYSLHEVKLNTCKMRFNLHEVRFTSHRSDSSFLDILFLEVVCGDLPLCKKKIKYFSPDNKVTMSHQTLPKIAVILPTGFTL